MKHTIEDIRLEQTCGACPEQYDAFIGNKQVGYLRLRHGHFRVDYPECGEETIYEAYPAGDGIFESHEREHYLKSAKKAIFEKVYGIQPDLVEKVYSMEDAKEMAFKCWMEALDVDWQCIPKGEYPVEFLRAWDKINPDE